MNEESTLTRELPDGARCISEFPHVFKDEGGFYYTIYLVESDGRAVLRKQTEEQYHASLSTELKEFIAAGC